MHTLGGPLGQASQRAAHGQVWPTPDLHLAHRVFLVLLFKVLARCQYLNTIGCFIGEVRFPALLKSICQPWTRTTHDSSPVLPGLPS